MQGYSVFCPLSCVRCLQNPYGFHSVMYFFLSRMQLAINVQIPKDADGVGGSAVYIGCASSAFSSIRHCCNMSVDIHLFWLTDTEGSFMVERALQMAESCVAHLQSHRALYSKHVGESCNVDSNIYYFRICDSTEQVT